MEELIRQFTGKKIDVSCGSSAVFRGVVQEVKAGVLYLVDEDDRAVFIAVEKIATMCECTDTSGRPGFIG